MSYSEVRTIVYQRTYIIRVREGEMPVEDADFAAIAEDVVDERFELVDNATVNEHSHVVDAFVTRERVI